jgi:hypothetical protein
MRVTAAFPRSAEAIMGGPAKRPNSDYLHPLVYKALVGLALWYVLAIWLGFGGYGYTDYLLVVVTGLFFFSVLLPAALWRIWRSHHDPHSSTRQSFRNWAAGDFNIWQDRTTGATAAIEILLPIAAVALGMTALIIAAHG